MTRTAPRGAVVIGTGLIGGSVGMALRAQGWRVTGRDRDPARLDEALQRGAIDRVGDDPEAELVLVAAPVDALAALVGEALERYPVAAVTDVGSVKAPVAAGVHHARFVPGHPMAGSEQEGLLGADPSMFQGAVWVLTPTSSTDPVMLARVHAVVRTLGADVVTLSPAEHDRMVAMVSHVPHLTAVSLMRLATDRSSEHGALLRLAAGGFRDMTRIASGHPAIWPDICAANRDAIVEVLDELVDELSAVRAAVEAGDRRALLNRLEQARAARVSLPAGAGPPEMLAELRVRIPDRPGELAAITAIATSLSVNICDLELAHSVEGGGGVAVLVVDADHAERLRSALDERGLAVALAPLT